MLTGLYRTLWTICFRTNLWKTWDEYIVSGSIFRRLMNKMFISHPFPQVMILGCSVSLFLVGNILLAIFLSLFIREADFPCYSSSKHHYHSIVMRNKFGFV